MKYFEIYVKFIEYFNSSGDMTEVQLTTPSSSSNSSTISARLGRKMIGTSVSDKFVGAISYLMVWNSTGNCGYTEQTR